MKYFAFRRIRNTALTSAALACLWWWVRSKERALESPALATGYLLLGVVGFLALYGVRKKLPYLPLGSASSWLQWHLYAGMGSVGLFALHAGVGWPHGVLDTLLATTYATTVGSGLVGLYLTRTIPAELSRVGEEVIYDRIPAHRRRLQQQARELVLESVAASGATTLADFYAARLLDYLELPRSFGYQLRPTTVRRRALMREMHDVRRFLSDQEQSFCESLFAVVRRKDDLDFQEARQKTLRFWLFVHIGLTCALLLLALLHGLVAHAFGGGEA